MAVDTSQGQKLKVVQPGTGLAAEGWLRRGRLNLGQHHRNRLTNVTFRTTVGGAVTKTVDYTYDVFNRLVRKKVVANSVTINMFFTGYDGINPTLAFDGTATTDVNNRFFCGPMVGQLFADEQVLTPTTAGNVIWPMGDHLGTNRDLGDFIGTAITITNCHWT